MKDATFLEALSNRFGARVTLLWVVADPEALARRQQARAADQDTSVKVTLPKPPACAHVLVDTSSVQEAEMKATALDAVTRAFSAEKTTGRVLCAGHVCVDVVLEGCGELGSREGYCEVQSTRLAAGAHSPSTKHSRTDDAAADAIRRAWLRFRRDGDTTEAVASRYRALGLSEVTALASDDFDAFAGMLSNPHTLRTTRALLNRAQYRLAARGRDPGSDPAHGALVRLSLIHI